MSMERFWNDVAYWHPGGEANRVIRSGATSVPGRYGKATFLPNSDPSYIVVPSAQTGVGAMPDWTYIMHYEMKYISVQYTNGVVVAGGDWMQVWFRYANTGSFGNVSAIYYNSHLDDTGISYVHTYNVPYLAAFAASRTLGTYRVTRIRLDTGVVDTHDRTGLTILRDLQHYDNWWGQEDEPATTRRWSANIYSYGLWARAWDRTDILELGRVLKNDALAPFAAPRVVHLQPTYQYVLPRRGR